MSTNQQMNSPRRTSLAAGLATLLGLVLLAFPAGAAQPKKLKEVPLMEARHDLPEHQLLDAGVQVFEHGLPIDEDALFELEAKGISDDVRKSEARYIPVRLKDTLRRTGFWDAVRVVPGGMDSQHLTVSSRIEESNGKRLVLAVSAVDATGREWLDKRYRQRADDRAYRASKDGVFRQPFQSLYHRIANDLAEVREKKSDSEIAEIRTVAELEFAAALAPVAFGDYLGTRRLCAS